MSLPCFYIEQYTPGLGNVAIDEVNSKHIVQVLRMKKGEMICLTNGKGYLLKAIISNDHKKQCLVDIVDEQFFPKTTPNITIAISLLKNMNRFEWFAEKATEIGVSKIIPLACSRTIKQNFRKDRIDNIIVSALLQSNQAWMPECANTTDIATVIDGNTSVEEKYIAHCLPDAAKQPLSKHTDAIILIGPEGDFTSDEISLALSKGYKPITLGTTRLRTETAGIVAASLLCVG